MQNVPAILILLGRFAFSSHFRAAGFARVSRTQPTPCQFHRPPITVTEMESILALTSSALWGVSDFYAGVVSKRRAPLAVVGASQFFGLLAMIVIAFATSSWGASLSYVPWSIMASLCGITGLFAFYTALATGTMGIVAPIASCGVVVPVAVGLLGGEIPTRFQVAGIVIAIVGVILATGPELRGDGDPRSVALAGVSGLLFGLVFVAIGKGSESSAIMTVTGMRLTSVLILTIVALAVRSIGGIQRGDLLILVLVGVFDALANVLLGISVQGSNLTIASVLGSLYPIVTILCAWKVLNERLRRIQYVGVGFAMIGVIAITAGAQF